MSRWIDNGLIDRLDMVNRVAEEKNIAPESVEKDWWVTTVLKAMFGLGIGQYAYFKGGTSLSKGGSGPLGRRSRSRKLLQNFRVKNGGFCPSSTSEATRGRENC